MAEDFLKGLCEPLVVWPINDGGFLSLCVADSIFIVLNTLLVITFGTARLVRLLQRESQIRPYTRGHLFEIMASVLQIILPTGNLIYTIIYSEAESSSIPILKYVLTFVLSGTWIFSLILLVIEYSRGSSHNWVIVSFWVLSSSIGGIRLQTFANENQEDTGSFVMIALECGISTLLSLSAMFFNKVPPAFTDDEDVPLINKNKNPEVYDISLSFKELSPPQNPSENINIFSAATYTWLNSLLKQGYKRALLHEDLPPVRKIDDAKEHIENFEIMWNRQRLLPKPSLVKAIFHTYWKDILISGLFKLGNDIAVFSGPLLLQYIIEFIENPEEPFYKGALFAFGLFLGYIVQSLAMNAHWQVAYGLNMNVRAALIGVIYKKSFYLSHNAKQKWKLGEIVNLQSLDTTRIGDVAIQMHQLWSGPLQIIISLVLLWQSLGPAGLGGLGVMILAMPIQARIFLKLSQIQKELMVQRDYRSKLLNEILQGIRVIKFFAWEDSYSEKVSVVRQTELKFLSIFWYMSAIMFFLFGFLPVAVAVVSFLLFTASGGELTATRAFTALALFDVMQFPLSFFPRVIGSCIESYVSVKRIQNYLEGAQLNPNENEEINLKGENAIEVKDASFEWEEGKPVLSNISVKIPPGTLVAVVGEVGSGKSSLLNGILGEVPKTSGEVMVKGSISYVPQQAWIKNATVKDNILFGRECKGKKYNATINACQLIKDLNMLPGGDGTEIGERGINLSGGQKQRISMARAVYNDADIYLLDDPLSAVDAHVGKAIFKQCIQGLLGSKTRILCTHQLQYMKNCDLIIVLGKGTIAEIGTYDQLMNNGENFSALINKHVNQNEEENDAKGEIEEKKENEDDKENKIVKKEERETGGVSFQVYLQYMKVFGGPLLVTLCLLTYVCGTGSLMTSNYWLTYWTNVADYKEAMRLYPNVTLQSPIVFDELGLGVYFYVMVYSLIGVVSAIFIMGQNLTVSVGAINSAKGVHQQMLDSVLHTPTSFFDTTPTGRILNRFGSDQYSVDVNLPRTLIISLIRIFDVISIIIMIASVTPIFMIVLIPLGFWYRYLQKYYITTSRELQRLDSISKSPIYGLFSETLAGISTIRAYKRILEFIDENSKRISYNQQAFYMWYSSNRWLGVRLEFVGTCVVFASAFFCVIQRSTIDAGLAGLSISYALRLTSALNSVVRLTTELENALVAVERCGQYTSLEKEAPSVIPTNRPSPNWPDKGAISIQNLTLRYRKGLPLVLKGVSADIKPNEKIGVVGRTGAGKSSLMLALFRIVEPETGTIIIDGEDITRLGLFDLRSRLAIIPQDPTLFTGTIRSNLDPFEKHSDEQILSALEAVGLGPQLEAMGSITAPVMEYGENMSVGSRQLMCLARAILRKSKVLVMDEATANVDFETDLMIQKTIRQEFSDVTVLTIAHRINTIIDYDRVLVLDSGEIVEFDVPQNLLVNPSSIFYSLAVEAGIINALDEQTETTTIL